MIKIRSGVGESQGDVTPPPGPLRLGSKDAGVSEYIQRNCSVEIIEPDQPHVDEKLRDYVNFRYSKHPDAGSERFTGVMSSILFERMIRGPMRFAVLRYGGWDLKVVGEHESAIASGSIIGVNSSKQTFVYPEKWFRSLLAAEGKHTMDELTTVVTSEQSPYSFKSFGEIENLLEGPVVGSKGSGFLLLVLVDERLQGLGLSERVLSKVLGYYHDAINVPYVFVYGRVPEISGDARVCSQFREQGGISAAVLNTYFRGVVDGKRHDWGVGFHMRAGAHIVCGLPNSCEDVNSLNCGYLGIYDLKELRGKGRV